MIKHTTHFHGCECQTHKLKIALNALIALRGHQEIVCGGCRGPSTICYILKRTFEALEKLDKGLPE